MRGWCIMWLSLMVFSGCRMELMVPSPDAGILQLKQYTAWGDAYTAGFTQSNWEPGSLRGLFPEAQEYAYPALLARQFAQTGEIDFSQDLLPGKGSGYVSLLEVRDAICEGQPPTIVTTQILPTTGWSEASDTLLNNLGIPHLKVANVQSDSLMLSSPFAARVGVKQAYTHAIREHKHQFATVWMGIHDVMEYALTGGGNVAFSITPAEKFRQEYSAIIEALLEGAGQPKYLAVGNIPDITNFPYFRAQGYNFRTLENCFGNPQPIYFRTSQPEEIRIAKEGDLILLNGRDRIGTLNQYEGYMGLNPQNPLPSTMVLDQTEASLVRNRILRYNEVIDSLVQEVNRVAGYNQVVMVDLYEGFTRLEGEWIQDGLRMSNAYLSGGIFSSDGIYLTPRGNAFVANLFIEAMNQVDGWTVSIPPLNLTDYPGVPYP